MRTRPFQTILQWFCRWLPSFIYSQPKPHPLQACLSEDFSTIDVMGEPKDVRHFYKVYQDLLWPAWEAGDTYNRFRDASIHAGCITLVSRGEQFCGRDPFNAAVLHACQSTGCHLTFSEIAPRFKTEWDARHRQFNLRPSVYGSHPALRPDWT